MSSTDDDKVAKAETLPWTESEKQAPPTEPGRDAADAPAPEAKPRPERTASFQDYLVRRPVQSSRVRKFVGSFTDMPETEAERDQFRSNLSLLSLYMFALFLGRLALNYINKLCFRMIGIRLSSAIRLHYLRRLFGQSIHVLDSMPPGYATTTITSTSNTLQLGISEKLGVFVEYSSTIVASIIIAFVYNWSLTLVTSSAILFIMLTVGILLPFIMKSHGRMTKSEAKSSAVASETMASIRMVMACGAEARIARKYAKFVEETKKHARFMSPIVALQFGLIVSTTLIPLAAGTCADTGKFFGAFSAFGLAFWYGTKSYVEGRLDNVGTIVIVLLSVFMVVLSLERTSTPLLAVGKATVAACQFFTVIDAPQPDKGHLKAPEVSSTDDIVLEKVTFAYPSRPHVKILDELDLRIEAGKITAIVGPSGSGKSTIVGLIERWYTLKEQYAIAKAVEQKKKKKKRNGESDDDDEEPGEVEPEETGPPIKLSGSVSTSGHSLDEIDLKWWRSQIGLVQQEPFLFNDTIYRNVANGLVGSEWEHEPEEKKRELVRGACKEAFADEFIDKLPEGYNTVVGDSGAKLSGGQRQRIAIARSIVRKPKILILDEATSAIDVRGERIVQAALDRVAQNRTTITVAHRLSTIKKADRIVVLKKGRVAESGTHQTLMARAGGIYAALVAAQALSLGGPTEASGGGGGDKDGGDKDGETSSLERTRSRAGSEAEAAALPADSQHGQRNLLSSFGRFFYESRPQWYLLALTVVFAACAGAAVPLQAWLFARVVVVFALAGDELLRESRFWSLMWVVLAAGTGLAYFGCFLASTQMAATMRAKYQAQYFEAMLRQRPAFFDAADHAQGTMTARASGDPQKLEELMGANMASVYIAVFNLAGSVAIAFAFGWKLALVACCIVMPVSAASTYWRFRYEMDFDRMNGEVFAESSSFAAEAIGAFRTVASLTLEGPMCARFERLCRGHVVAAFNKARWASLLFAFSDSVTMACQALIFYYGGRLLASGEYQPLNFFVCFMATIQSAEAAGQGLSFGPNAAQVTAASNRILDMRESRLADDDASPAGAIPDARGGVSIELDNLHFTYPTRDVPVFQGLSLTIEKGQFAALVGASGCGKTSIISLLERRALLHLVSPSDLSLTACQVLRPRQGPHPVQRQGHCRGQPLRIPQAPLPRRPRGHPLPRRAAAENILLGVDDSAVTDAQLHQACRDASIHDFIVSLPDGYGTNIGSKGVTLSGGQKQRVAIARALIRDPDVLLLDEATSSLDSESERLVQAAFERAGRGRTMLVVAHRLATVQNAHVIFVLGEGRLLEKGSHAELLSQRGVYWQMVSPRPVALDLVARAKLWIGKGHACIHCTRLARYEAAFL
ncbi:Multidrug resistance protein 1B [Tolypocladium paradoxum]|uniref:Multidrug resistance protein 1B n=1 Tax=Tolypocladium paradoxum TaxID=94208 RepID=A0A2S4KPH4_9HYPO|nr:Multidrug resistance protein 1B [Tolypocladium paradoxum]